jgi:hypothetical protein
MKFHALAVLAFNPLSEALKVLTDSSATLADPDAVECHYMKGSPQSSRPGTPCLPASPFWPYSGKTDWKIDLGKRILAVVTPKISEDQCGGFYLYGDSAWCNKAFDGSKGKAQLGLSFGIEERDIWSELVSEKHHLPTKLYDCFIPLERSTPMSGKAPNATKKCVGVEDAPCYSTSYESYRTCLGAKAGEFEGHHFETLLTQLTGLPPLSVHLKIDTEGSEWGVLEELMDSPEDLAKIRTLDMEVHFGWENLGDLDSWASFSKQQRLTKQVEIFERLQDKFAVTGSTLETYREGWHPEDNCKDGKCKEPPVYLPGGFSVEMFAVSFVNKDMLA